MATILLHGPSGCGKSLLAEATVNAFVERASGATAVRVRMTALLSKYVGESEGGLQLIFKRARELALRHGRHALIIEDVDMVATGKGSPLAKQLAAEIDDLPAGNTLLVVFTTNRLDLVPAELTSPSRVDITMLVDRPDAVAAREILHRRLAKAPWSLDEAGAAVDAAVERLYASGEFRQAASAAALSRVTRVAARRAAFRAAKTCELLRLTADDLLAAAAAEIEAIRH
jgi:proteasome-associated ATPase